MKDIHLHNILKELSTNLACPHCNEKVFVQDINLINSSWNTCTFDFICKNCSKKSQLTAVIEEKKIINNEVNQNKEIKKVIDESESQEIKEKLKNFKSFNQLFDE